MQLNTKKPSKPAWRLHGTIVGISMLVASGFMFVTDDSNAAAQQQLTLPLPVQKPLSKPAQPALSKSADAQIISKTTQALLDELPTIELTVDQRLASSAVKEHHELAHSTSEPAHHDIYHSLKPDYHWQKVQVKPGDSLALIAQRQSISHQDIHRLAQADTDKVLTRLHPGDELRLDIDDEQLMALEYDLDAFTTLKAERDQDAFILRMVERPYDVQTQQATGTITYSLFTAAQAAGLDHRLTMQLAGIFAWDVDFALEVRKDDQFSVIYEEKYQNGKKVGNGNILAADFINKGIRYRAIRYTDADGEAGYFTPEGKSLKKAFLRNPVEFTRITSKFNLSRRHPILHKIRAHKGVDYGAKTGTPIRSVGDGRITFRGVKGGYGNVVVVQHGQRYSTLYAHLSRFGKKQKVGTKLEQGQVLGYVGQSGLATGPHLHYEFRVDGIHRNPLTVKHPSADPIPQQDMARFKQQTQPHLAQLEQLDLKVAKLN